MVGTVQTVSIGSKFQSAGIGLADGRFIVAHSELDLAFNSDVLAQIFDPRDASNTPVYAPVSQVIGLIGNDSITSNAALVNEHTGNDTILGGALNQTILGGEGQDSLDGGAGDDTVDGGLGNDTLIDDSGVDSLIGGEGDDLFRYSGNNFLIDNVDGGGGTDTYDAALDSAGRNVDLVTGLMSDGFTTTTITGVENLIGSMGNDTLLGDSQANVLEGRIGNDTLNGREGNDTINGEDGADSIDGGAGDDLIIDGFASSINARDSHGEDTFNAGSGNDTLRVFAFNNGESYDGGADTDTLDASLGSGFVNVDLAAGTVIERVGGGFTMTAVNFEHYLDTNGTSVISGTAGANRLFGNGGDDSIQGLGGNDTINGGAGNDNILGGDNADLIIDGSFDAVLGANGDGDDFVVAGGGNDTVQVFVQDANDFFDGGADTDTLDMTMGQDSYRVDLQI